MARYFFNVVDEVSKNVVKDVEGCEFSCVHEARKEAISFARDIAKHGFGALNQTGEVVVTNESGTELLKIPLSGRRATARAWFDLRQCSARLEAVYGQHTLALLLMAALMFIIVHTADKKIITKDNSGYQIASTATATGVIAVRFAPQASAAQISQFLDAYNAAVVSGPSPGGFFRLRIGDATLSQEELAKIVTRMTQEKVVELAAVMQ
jgi:hypothetical protein